MVVIANWSTDVDVGQIIDILPKYMYHDDVEVFIQKGW
jgi:hypothetical protein